MQYSLPQKYLDEQQVIFEEYLNLPSDPGWNEFFDMKASVGLKKCMADRKKEREEYMARGLML